MVSIAVVNQKGGVGKTTVVLGLTSAAARRGIRTLVVDMDPQGNATTGLGVFEPTRSIDSVLVEERPGGLRATVEPTGWTTGCEPLPMLAASSPSLAVREAQLSTDPLGAQDRLRLAMRGNDVPLVLIDCPPSLSLLTVNALSAADTVLIPMQCEYYALEGLAALMNTVEQIQETVNPNLQVEGILRTMYDPRNSLTLDVSGQLSEYFGDKVYRAVIPRNVRLAEAPSYGVPALKYDRASKGAIAYLALAGEMVRRHGSKKTSAPVAV